MKKINWVIDKYLFDEYEDKLAVSIKNSGANVYFYDDICGKLFKDWITSKFNQDDIVVFHGSLQHGRQLTHMPIYPGTFMNIDNYECYKYYGYYGDNLLNSQYLMMGLNDVIRRKEKIKEEFCLSLHSVCEGQKLYRWDNKNIFIRPSNGYKTFTGQVISLDNLENEIDVLKKSYGSIDDNVLVLISNAQDLEEEYRFSIIDGEVITGSLYMDENNRKDFKAYYDKPINSGEAFDFAVKISKLYTPDKAFTIDICRTKKDEYKLLEINSFNCASMYGSEYDKIVDAINKLAEKEYKELFTL